ncbi:MAG: hypothetical protein ACI85F_002728 [Bacteroidia bacterium]|jgi:hypothetical protein
MKTYTLNLLAIIGLSLAAYSIIHSIATNASPNNRINFFDLENLNETRHPLKLSGESMEFAAGSACGSLTISGQNVTCGVAMDGKVTVSGHIFPVQLPVSYKLSGDGGFTAVTGIASDADIELEFENLAPGDYEFQIMSVSSVCNQLNSLDSIGIVMIETDFLDPGVVITGPITVEPILDYPYSFPAIGGYDITWTCIGGAIVSGQGTNTARVIWDNTMGGSLNVELDNGSCLFSYDFSTNPAGVNEILSDKIGVYPNPSSGDFTISIPVDAKIDLINLEGKTIDSRNTSAGSFDLGLPDLPRGTYILQLTSEEGIGTKRIIKED